MSDAPCRHQSELLRRIRDSVLVNKDDPALHTRPVDVYEHEPWLHTVQVQAQNEDDDAPEMVAQLEPMQTANRF